MRGKSSRATGRLNHTRAFWRRLAGDIRPVLRALAIALAVALVVFAVTGGHVFFFPFLFIPLGLFGFGHRRNRRSRFFL